MAEHGNADTDVLTSHDVRAILGIDHTKLSRMIAKGEIQPLPFNPALKHPRPYLFTRAEVNRIVAVMERRREDQMRRLGYVAESRATYNAQAS